MTKPHSPIMFVMYSAMINIEVSRCITIMTQCMCHVEHTVTSVTLQQLLFTIINWCWKMVLPYCSHH